MFILLGIEKNILKLNFNKIMIPITIVNFIFYYLASIFSNFKFKIGFSLLFILSTIVLRLVVNNSQLPDYDSYYSIIGIIEPEFSFKILFTEPYYFQLVNYFNKTYSSETSINFFYTINYLISTTFFVWLLFVNKVSPWKKVLLFSLYYYVFAFILLRNTISYIMIAILYYRLNYNKINKTSFLAFFSHLSSLPVLGSSLFRNKKGDLKLIVSGICYVLFFSILIRLEAFNVYEKFSAYQESKDYGVSFFHKFYFYFFLIVNVFLFIYKRKMVFNYTYLPIFLTYILLQYANAVMGYRFSIYLMLYLLLFINDVKEDIYINTKLNLISFFFIFLMLFNLKSIFP
ncbi:MAG: hypothetical protein RLZZ323_1346 [Bacteroidota bacterium]